ncbi:MAG: flagellin lysine-N-methylase [Oscillospiraceae bacterium]|nr:flagellin lysine-N-methylase [Oscillospiraceae bacterium]
MNQSIYPDYYEQFACLMGSCRLNCCRENWDIPLMKEEYEAIRAAARKNKGELADLIGMALAKEGSPAGAYAHIRHGKDGACPLCTTEGLCRLHAACGAEVLGSVCRTFPRSHVMWNGRHRQACSAGCQATIELLKNREAPIAFVKGDFVADGWAMNRGTYSLPEKMLADRPMLRRLEQLQEDMAAVLQQRQLSMSARMGQLADGLYRLDKAEKEGQSDAQFAVANPPETFAGDLRDALAAVTLFTTVFYQLGSTQEQDFIRTVWDNCGVRFQQGKMGAELRLDQTCYEECAAKREALWAQNAPNLWEHLMVNQLFQDRLPFGDGSTTVWENTLYFCAVYAILRFLAAGAAQSGWPATEDALVRGLRKYTHSTQLMARTVEQLKRRGMDTPQGLAALLAL